MVLSRCRSLLGSRVGGKAASPTQQVRPWGEAGGPHAEGHTAGTHDALATVVLASPRAVGLDAGGVGLSPGQLGHHTAM